jgi:hypothetical protein
MWSAGVPAGFCNDDAYGYPTKEGRFRYDGYVPALACYGHGGPIKNQLDNLTLELDGDMFCAKRKDFLDLQASTAGFGATEDEAVSDLLWQEALNG